MRREAYECCRRDRDNREHIDTLHQRTCHAENCSSQVHLIISMLKGIHELRGRKDEMWMGNEEHDGRNEREYRLYDRKQCHHIQDHTH